ncbi:MAG TPA: hypothetical protein VFZ98_08730 [Vicinamibacterales bacterium]
MQTRMKDLTVELGPDRPGTLGRALEAIAKASINVEGYAAIAGTFHLLTKDGAATRRALESGKFRIAREDDVVVVDLADRPGIAASLFGHLGDAGVNVAFSYVATGNRVVVGAVDVKKATEVIARETAAVG